MKKYLVLSVLLLQGCKDKIKADFISEIEFNNKYLNISVFTKENEKSYAPNTFDLESSGTKLKIKIETVASKAQAEKLLNEKTATIKLMFSPQQVPYFGKVTQSTSCLQAIEIDKPLTENENQISTYFNLTATERFIYGSCISDQEIYRSQLLYLFCKKSNKLFEIKYFFPKNQPYTDQLAYCK